MNPRIEDRSIVQRVDQISRHGTVTLSSFTPRADPRPWLSMKTNTSDTANKPTMATRKSIPSFRCRLPPVKRVTLLLSIPIIAIPRPMAEARAALAWFLEAMPPSVENASR